MIMGTVKKISEDSVFSLENTYCELRADDNTDSSLVIVMLLTTRERVSISKDELS